MVPMSESWQSSKSPANGEMRVFPGMSSWLSKDEGLLVKLSFLLGH